MLFLCRYLSGYLINLGIAEILIVLIVALEYMAGKTTFSKLNLSPNCTQTQQYLSA